MWKVGSGVWVKEGKGTGCKLTSLRAVGSSMSLYLFASKDSALVPKVSHGARSTAPSSGSLRWTRGMLSLG